MHPHATQTGPSEQLLLTLTRMGFFSMTYEKLFINVVTVFTPKSRSSLLTIFTFLEDRDYACLFITVSLTAELLHRMCSVNFNRMIEKLH